MRKTVENNSVNETQRVVKKAFDQLSIVKRNLVKKVSKKDKKKIHPVESHGSTIIWLFLHSKINKNNLSKAAIAS